MPKKPRRGPSEAYRREVVAARRVGEGKQCACGERRPWALIPESNPTLCAECRRKRRGQKTTDDHHVARKANNPATIPTPVNDHRARLTVDQYDWPKQTRENTDGSPILASAACIRGFIDYLHYLIDKFLSWIPEMLEILHPFLVEKFGPKWWVNTDLDQFSPKR
jgi:hypothetical protein